MASSNTGKPPEPDTDLRHDLSPNSVEFMLDEKLRRSHKDSSNLPAHRPSVGISAAERARRHLNAKLANPLQDFSYAELRRMGRAYAIEHGLDGNEEDMRALEIGAMIARDPTDIDVARDLGVTKEELEVLEKELTHRWHQPWTLYLVIMLCSTCAAVQGMDETVVNGAQLFFVRQFGIGGTDSRSTWLTGLVNGAPYMCCAFIGCWLTTPLNTWFGRRGTIFLTCLISALACFWQGFVNTWWHMFISRFALGLGIGPKSATVPIYAAECAPPAIRGALVMQWQMWTAFGIMFGYAADLAFYAVPSTHNIEGLNWRLMMASAMIPAVMGCCFVFLCPESPRFHMSKGRHGDAYRVMCKLRFNKIQAARDLFYMSELLKAEENMKIGQSLVRELIMVPRNRRALLASEIVMFMQQFCGVNVIAYYSSAIFVESGFSQRAALAASLGWGIINFLFAIPAIYTIDTFGRRNLLLTTFPLMSLSLLFTGFSFWIPSSSSAKAISSPHAFNTTTTTIPSSVHPPSTPSSPTKLACIALGTYLFGIFYSPGEGPVPFTYSAEAYPLYVRTLGMSVATATTWFFNWCLSITWPSMKESWGVQGAFGWYAAWCAVGWWGVLCFMPETKSKTLEELDQIFSIPTHLHAAYGLRQIPYFIKRYLLRNKNVVPESLFDKEEKEGQRGEWVGVV